MKAFRKTLDRIEPLVSRNGGKYPGLYPFYEALDTFLYTPGTVNKGQTHVRDGLDLKRMMITVVIALMPCVLFGLYNTGYQANLAMANLGLETTVGWRGDLIGLLGVGYDPSSVFANVFHGALYFIPVYLVCNLTGAFWEGLFASVRKHEINEGFLVTGMLIPLIMPATIPLWQVIVATSFAVVVGKEVFGGTGKNFLNVALLARAFLYFAYPAQISGDAVWTAVDGYTAATPLGLAASGGLNAMSGTGIEWSDAFLGSISGSMGETSALAVLLGAAYLIYTGVASWRVMVACLLGALALTGLIYSVGSETNPMYSIPPHWHLVLGGFAFGAVFMATDPVTSPSTSMGKWIYGFLIGFMAMLIRTLNPAYPEGVFAILLLNVFAPTIDYYVVKANIRRRKARYAEG